MQTYQVVTEIIRIDDGEVFSINDDGTFSLELMKRDYPNSHRSDYSIKALLNGDGFKVGKVKKIEIME